MEFRALSKSVGLYKRNWFEKLSNLWLSWHLFISKNAYKSAKTLEKMQKSIPAISTKFRAGAPPKNFKTMSLKGEGGIRVNCLWNRRPGI